MQSRFTAALSLTGVLLAGSAAALVNTRVLRDKPSLATGAAAMLAAEGAGPDVTLGATLDATEDSQGGARRVTLNEVAYEVADAGIVVLDSSNDRLTIVSVAPAAGWIVRDQNQKTPTHAHIEFLSGVTVVSFEANLLFGVVGTSVEVWQLDDSGGAGGSSAVSATIGGVSITTTTTAAFTTTTTTVHTDPASGGSGSINAPRTTTTIELNDD